MPIRNQIEAVVQTLTGSPTFIYGMPMSLNKLADDAHSLVVYYPLQPIDISPQVNGSVDNTFSFTWSFCLKQILTNTHQPTKPM